MSADERQGRGRHGSQRGDRAGDGGGVARGAGGGMGRATAVAFARRGDKVALLARGEKGLQAAAEDVRAAGGTPLVVPVDVADAKAVEAAADRVEAELGPLAGGGNGRFREGLAP